VSKSLVYHLYGSVASCWLCHSVYIRRCSLLLVETDCLWISDRTIAWGFCCHLVGDRPRVFILVLTVGPSASWCLPVFWFLACSSHVLRPRAARSSVNAPRLNPTEKSGCGRGWVIGIELVARSNWRLVGEELLIEYSPRLMSD